MNTIYIHDAPRSGKLIIRKIPDTVPEPQDDYEEAVEAIAEQEDMHFSDSSWGSVGEISIEL
jgi:hypothetical protein